ncbi:MAG: histidine kinase [Paucimonas sp.]|nr:histidine kinase [Paucimonas sp.]
MSLASDQKPGPADPSGISGKLLELTDRVFSEWEKRVRASLPKAGSLPYPILINTLPTFYKNLVEALTPDYPRTTAEVTGPAVASEHGGERARLTRYRAEDLIAEYQVLRETVGDVLRQDGYQPKDEEMGIIDAAFNAAIRESASAFTLTQSAFREQFVATVVHDIRNPLATALYSAQLIRHDPNPEAMKGHAAKILENLNRVDQMLREVLDRIVLEHGARILLEPSNFDISELAREVCRESAPSTSSRLVIASTPIPGWWDRSYMKRALENLIGNALKHGASDGPIRIACVEAGGRMALSVHNEGTPIPVDQLESIFQVFRRAQAIKSGDRKGWGIGLPFVRSVAECHGGSIDVDSSLERGTTFTIDVPIDCRPFQRVPILEGKIEPAPGENT